jgi:hypothetical protein
MSKIDIPKETAYVIIGPDSDEESITKVVAYVILEPGSETPVPPSKARAYANITRRLRR